MWFTENPWPGVVIGLVFACIFLFRASQGGRSYNWILAGVFVLVALAAYGLEQFIVTPAEEVEAQVYQLLTDCKAGNAEEVLGQISNNNLVLKTVIASGLAMAEIKDNVRLTDLSVRTMAENSRAISSFRANGTVSLKNTDFSGHASTRWNVTWQKEGDNWKIISVQRLNPINGSEMGILEQSN